MAPVVTLITTASLPTATSLAASSTSRSGQAGVKIVSKKPYDRPVASSKLKEENVVLSFSSDSILRRVPPSFPVAAAERSAYRRPEGSSGGKQVTAFQWKLYDLLLQVPAGKVTTYGQLAALLSSSPRAAGSALRNNPFAPTVPCHRIIAATGFIGGFGGEWTGEPKKGSFAPGEKVREKLELLRREGVEFDGKGFLKDKKHLWDGKATP
ncbi:hypothetical protein JCM8547_002573 [Rhodosporidiobolus lusitaniae]